MNRPELFRPAPALLPRLEERERARRLGLDLGVGLVRHGVQRQWVRRAVGQCRRAPQWRGWIPRRGLDGGCRCCRAGPLGWHTPRAAPGANVAIVEMPIGAPRLRSSRSAHALGHTGEAGIPRSGLGGAVAGPVHSAAPGAGVAGEPATGSSRSLGGCPRTAQVEKFEDTRSSAGTSSSYAVRQNALMPGGASEPFGEIRDQARWGPARGAGKPLRREAFPSGRLRRRGSCATESTGRPVWA